MRSYYNAVDTIIDAAKKQDYIHTFTEGDIFQVDLDKKGIYPLLHITPLGVSWPTNATAIYRFQVSVAELVDIDLADRSILDELGAQDNTRDVSTQTLNSVNKLIKELRGYSLSESLGRLTGVPTADPFKEKYKNLLAGWTVTLEIEVANTIC